MTFSPFHLFSDHAYSDIRDKRSAIIGYSLSVIIGIMILQWIVIAYLAGSPKLLAFQLMIMLLVLIGPVLIYLKRLPAGFSALLVASYIYIMSVSVLFEGMSSDIHNKTVYFLIPLLVVTQYYAIYFPRKFTITFTLICFISLAIYQLPIAELPPLIVLPQHESLDKISQLIVPAAVIFIVLIFSILSVNSVIAAERSYNNANNTLSMIMENMLPKEVANRLKTEGRTFADAIKECTVLFAHVEIPIEYEDITSNQEINLLRQVFEEFEEETEKMGLEKIKTIGSSLMVVAGVPKARDDHAESAVELAQIFQQVALKHELHLRTGINSGPAIAGLIGKTRFVYDLWGDTVNVASRLESHGVIGKIHISSRTAKLIKHKYRLEKSVDTALKGRGEMTTYYIDPQHESA